MSDALCMQDLALNYYPKHSPNLGSELHAQALFQPLSTQRAETVWALDPKTQALPSPAPSALQPKPYLKGQGT